MKRLAPALLCAIAALAAACGDDSAAPSPTAGGGASATAGATPGDGDIPTLRLVEPAELPADAAFYVATGCFQCDGPTTGIVRMLRHQSGALAQDVIFDTPPGATISSHAISANGGNIAISTCAPADCGLVGGAQPGLRTTIHASIDGGITYTTLAPLDGLWVVVAAYDGGLVLNGPIGETATPAQFVRFPGMAPIAPPTAAGLASEPQVLNDGTLLWRGAGGNTLYLDGGSVFLDVGAGRRISEVRDITGGAERRLIVTFSEGAEANMRFFAGVATVAGAATLRAVYDTRGHASVRGLVGRGVFAGNVSLSAEEAGITPAPQGIPFVNWLPALFDLDARTVSPITAPFLEEPYFNGRNHVLAVVNGPFVRVTNTGDCLNVRAEPALSAQPLDCPVDNVLLVTLGEQRDVDGATWLRVRTPRGIEGWAHGGFLEREPGVTVAPRPPD